MEEIEEKGILVDRKAKANGHGMRQQRQQAAIVQHRERTV